MRREFYLLRWGVRSNMSMLGVPAKGEFDTRGRTEDAWSCDPLLVDDITGAAVVVAVEADEPRAVAAIELCATVCCIDVVIGTVLDLSGGVIDSTVGCPTFEEWLIRQ